MVLGNMKERRIISFEDHSFSECIEKDDDLAALRAEYKRKSAEERRMAADGAYHSAIADNLFNNALLRVGQAKWRETRWSEGIVALAIDPLFAPRCS